MLSDDDNQLLCRVGRGTPMGEVFRRFWLPALCTSELASDGAPRRLRLLGEDLVAFRNTSGEAGIIGAYCPHKLAPLYFGRNEECGLRCAYHGWKFDTLGHCVEIPNLPANFDTQALKRKAKISGYPVREAGGMLWVYMGPADKMPPLPAMEWLRAPVDHVYTARWLQRTNWAQGMEGEIDSSHISWLHRDLVPRPPALVAQTSPLIKGLVDGAPVMKLVERDYGFVYGARRQTDTGDYYWRITQWMLPMFSQIPNDAFPRTGRAWVPIDDDHTSVVTYAYRADRAFTRTEIDYIEEGNGFPPPLQPSVFTMPGGYRIDIFESVATKENDFQLDRMRQRGVNYSGIHAITDQDRALQENMPGMGARIGGIVDRSRELLVASDLPVITARRMLLKLARDMRDGIEPSLPHNPSAFNVRSTSAVTRESEFDDFLQNHSAEMIAPA